MARKKPTRKRRSFFEPDSKVITKWLADQNDLGVSLQVIIVDAIRNYGDGDVLQAYLRARESVPGEVPTTRSYPGENTVFTPPVAAKAAPKAEPKADVPVVESKPAAKAKQTSEPVGVLKPVTPKAEPKIEDAELELEAETPPVPKSVTVPEALEDEPYDPLEVMFNDIDSNMNN